jgi:8-oxo-dGTP pyrophosphatase MutT (NUDIX family)
MTELDRVLARPEVLHLAELLVRRPGARVEYPADAAARRAAVALILRLGAGGALELLMIKRAVYAGDPWSGHVALPGGRHEPGDVSLAETAIRETREETAVDLATRGRLLGTLDDLEPRTPVLPPIVITPFVAVVEPDVHIVTSPEVARAFWVPVAALRNPDASREVELMVRGTPRRVMSFGYGEHTIWGLTERILRQFLTLTGG